LGTYLNPGNAGFRKIIESEYVDKTGLIRLINRSIGTNQNLTCISRPRRFGKSYAARMLCAYYDRTCDSRELFSGYTIAKDPAYEKHLNKYHVINLDITSFISDAKIANIPLKEIPAMITQAVLTDVKECYPELAEYDTLSNCLPALVIELKWNRSAGGAIRQIRGKGYQEILADYGGEVVLAGLSYDNNTKQHSCRIEFGNK